MAIRHSHGNSGKKTTGFKICVVCKKKFTKPKGYSNRQWHDVKCCCRKCSTVLASKNRKKRTIDKYLKMGMKIPVNPTGLCMCGCGKKTRISKWSSFKDNTIQGQHVCYVNGHGTSSHAKKSGGLGKYGYGRYKNFQGYIIVKLDTLSKKEQSLFSSMKINYAGMEAIPEHRLVMAKKIGKPLTRKENVHHKNGQRKDNRIENLELWITAQVPGVRVKDICKHCGGTGLV